MSKLDIERYERMGAFFQKVLQPSLQSINQLMRKCGEDGYLHDYVVEQKVVSEEYTMTAHQITMMLDVKSPIETIAQMRKLIDELNEQLQEAVRLELLINLVKDIDLIDFNPDEDVENYNGRYAYILRADAPNLVFTNEDNEN